MGFYVIPEKYYFRIHHVRPRFKNDIENVLFYVAEEIAAIGELPKKEFVEKLNAALYKFPGNANRALKTINNWRTEISALFGFIEHNGDNDKPGQRAIELAAHSDLLEAFKTFLYNFQYPGAHIKSKNVLEQIEAGIKFKPAQYILQVLRYANNQGGNSIGLTKAEVCHCIFNDLRVTRDHEGAQRTWERIAQNRKDHVIYDQTGDVIRYAGDIIDYMEIANLLKTYDHFTYYLNTLEEESIIKFCQSKEWFSGYDTMISKREGDIAEIGEIANAWFSYVNRNMNDTDFSTDILAYIAKDSAELKALRKNTKASEENLEDLLNKQHTAITNRISNDLNSFRTKDIGDIGESLIYGHECMRLKLAGCLDLIHLVKRIPTQFAVGYDIGSVETDGRKRYIEVKTTISSKPLDFNKVHMTKNEWNTADSIHDRYYIYRLGLSKNERKLFLLQDPVGLYKKDVISMTPEDGATISFDPKTAGHFEELLTWES